MEADDVARFYRAALDSVALINGGKPDSVSDAEWADAVARNKEHLRGCLEKPWWDDYDYDLTPLRDAAEWPDGAPPIAPTPRFIARDMVALLTADDYASIAAAIASDPALGLLWSGLLAQGSAPIRINSERVTAGLAGLKAALGAERVLEIFTALGVDIPAEGVEARGASVESTGGV